jgi:hypothetical protein
MQRCKLLLNNSLYSRLEKTQNYDSNFSRNTDCNIDEHISSQKTRATNFKTDKITTCVLKTTETSPPTKRTIYSGLIPRE